MNHLNRFRVVTFALTALFAAALAGPPAPLSAQQRTRVRIATAAVETSAVIFYAQELGYFDRAGIDVTTTRLANGAAISAAVLSGTVDVGFANTTSVELAHVKGLPLAVIDGAGLHDAAHPTNGLLVVSRSSTIRTGKDFAGKTVAVPGLGIVTDLGGRAWIDRNGGDSKLSHYVEIPISAMAQALVTNRVDAAVMDSATSKGEEGAQLRVVASALDAIAPKFLASVWFTTSDWIAQHPDVAKKVAGIIREASIWANAHPREAVAIFVKHSSHTEADLLKVDRPEFATSASPELLQPTIDAAAKYGLIKAPFPAKELIATFPK